MALLSTVYCTVAELNRFLSLQAVEDFAEHDGDAAVEDCINQATEEIDMMAGQRYKQSDLAASEIITRWCVVIASRFLCQRRGNVVPDSIEAEWSRIEGHLQAIADGRRQLPRVPLRADLRPTWSNLTVDRRYSQSSVRVLTGASSNAASTVSVDAADPAVGTGIGYWVIEDTFTVS